MENRNLYLPVELVNKILLRLPVKSLGRCKCVCKLWCSIISSTCFNFQHQNHTKDDNTSNLYLILDTPINSVTDPLMRKTVLRFSYDTFEAVQTLYPDPSLKHPRSGRYFHIEYTCNGLFLFSYFKKPNFILFLWNPTTGESKLLPLSSSQAQSLAQYRAQSRAQALKKLKKKITFQNLGFGFDTKTMDYKVVFIHNHKYKGIDEVVVVVEMYSLKTNSWTTIATHSRKDFQTYAYYDGRAVFSNGVNGMLSWKAMHKEDGDVYDKIISLDLSRETIITTLLPSSISRPHLHRYPDNRSNYPFLYKESLALVNYPVVSRSENRTFEIWVLGEYGVKESWKKLFTIGTLPRRISQVLGFWEDGKVLVQTYCGTKFSPQTHKATYVKRLLLFDVLNPTQRLQIFKGTYTKMFTYRETLVSLKS
ncbi:F-box/kelch-repeat protein At3g23880-like [Ziziphus jujuba]|uniref:F-box/kelch-repeat protein At3g23880-like n=1 Tax=Ziziphus jujuba TaxID=326968 RepID=A0ABM3IAY6_ZIZJJ|nr:F-box/kelch-repeat protein At3g23880-like [Ziziphus jujuba]